jgi:hypothetical protein
MKKPDLFEDYLDFSERPNYDFSNDFSIPFSLSYQFNSTNSPTQLPSSNSLWIQSPSLGQLTHSSPLSPWKDPVLLRTRTRSSDKRFVSPHRISGTFQSDSSPTPMRTRNALLPITNVLLPVIKEQPSPKSIHANVAPPLKQANAKQMQRKTQAAAQPIKKVLPPMARKVAPDTQPLKPVKRKALNYEESDYCPSPSKLPSPITQTNTKKKSSKKEEKRFRNREAARRSRQRKLDLITSLQAQVEELESLLVEKDRIIEQLRN